MTLKTSLLITGDSSAAQKAVDDLRRSVDGAATATKSSAAGFNTVAGAVDTAAAKFRQHSKAINDNQADMARHAAGVRNLGQQFGDLSVMIGGGIDPMRAFATQAGQMGYAMSEMRGKAGAIGAFLTGPWGIALTVAVTALAPLAEKLFETADAAGSVEAASNGLRTAQDALGGMFDLTTGKLLKQNAALSASNELMRVNAQIAALNLRREAVQERASSLGTFANAGRVSVMDRVKAAFTTPGDLVDSYRGLFNGTKQGQQNARALEALVERVRSGRISAENAVRASQKLDFTGTKATREEFEKALLDKLSSTLKVQAADLTDRALSTGVLPEELRRPASSGAVSRMPRARREPRAASDRSHAAALAAEAKAASATQRALDALDASMTRIIGRYDPAADAAATYRKELEEISRLSMAGRLTPEQALDFGQQAGAIMRKRTADAQMTALGLTPEQVSSDIGRLGVLINGVADDYGRRLSDGSRRAGDELASAIGNIAESFGVDLRGAIGVMQRSREYRKETADTITGVLQRVGLGKDTAGAIGKGAGKALAGAMQGQMAAGVAGMLGIKTSNTGAGIGGAIGSILPIPGGSIIGGLVGGVLGGLFKKTPSGSASITSVDGAASVSGSKSVTGALTGVAKSVQSTVQQIADALGADTGAFNVSIGKRGDYYRVSSTGATNTGEKKVNRISGLIYDGTDEAQAIMVAVRDAISDGAVTGISAAVKKALGSSADIDKAMREAMKVQSVEVLAQGIAGEMRKAFSDFEKTAKERVRIAQQYGFDVVAIEKRNAEDRAKLTDQLVKQQAGSLKSLIEEMTSGNLFEGTAMDKIAALNTRIAKAKADMEAGTDGAADALANLYQQRLAASKEAFGTTGAYAADRTATIAEAQAAIARVNAQVTAATSTSDPALKQTNTTLDEISEQTARLLAQNAQMVAALTTGNALLQQLGGGFNLYEIAHFGSRV